MEHVREIPKINNLGIDPDFDMAINCEWVCSDFTSALDAIFSDSD